jgi:Zinc finger, C2H2 type
MEMRRWSINMSCVLQFSIKLIMEFICKTCNKSFKYQSNLSRHGRIHKSLRVTCDCGLSFSRSDSLLTHQATSSTCKVHAAEQTAPHDDIETDSNHAESHVSNATSIASPENDVFGDPYEKTIIPKPDPKMVPEDDIESSSDAEKSTLSDDSDTSHVSSVQVTRKNRKHDVSDESGTHSDSSTHSDSDTSSNKSTVAKNRKHIKPCVQVTRKTRKRVIQKKRRPKVRKPIRRLGNVKSSLTGNPMLTKFPHYASYITNPTPGGFFNTSPYTSYTTNSRLSNLLNTPRYINRMSKRLQNSIPTFNNVYSMCR